MNTPTPEPAPNTRLPDPKTTQTFRTEKNLTQGRMYTVPVIRGPWRPRTKSITAWWPVLGPVHSDLEIIGFKPHHHHVDFRFLTQNLRRPDTTHSHAVHPCHYIPITDVSPEGGIRPEWELKKNFKKFAQDQQQFNLWTTSSDTNQIPLDYLSTPPGKLIPPDTYRKDAKRLYQGPWVQYPDRYIPWLMKLTAAYQNAKLRPDMICPHRGTDLSGIEPQDDVITCPLHGLRWNAQTGEALVAVPSPRPESK